MDFPGSLLSVLRGAGADADLAGFAVASLNDNVEASFCSAATLPNPQGDFDPDVIVSKLEEVAALLHSIILACIMSEDPRRDILTDEEAEMYAQETMKRIKESQDVLLQQEGGDSEMKNLAELLRACKNLIRWYLQIFCKAAAAAKGGGPSVRLPSMPLKRLESHAMMELYLWMVQKTAGNARNDARQQVARHACLSLFYATYSPSSSSSGNNDQQIQRAQQHLVDIGFVDICMQLLLHPTTTEVLVCLVRLVHNLVTSLPGMVELVQETRLRVEQCTELSDAAPWAPPRTGDDEEVVDLPCLLIHVLMWALRATPAFPGEVSDRRTDLVVEILRILYVFRAGRNVMESSSDSHMAKLMAYFLKLPNSEERAYQCKLAAISLLMDAPAEYSDVMVDQKMVVPLLAVLDLQVTRVVESSSSHIASSVPTAAASAAAVVVVPILSVVTKFCSHNQTFKSKTKLAIFPQGAAEERFLERVAEMQQQQQQQQPNNMHPLDAPGGTLRWKLVELMKWTEGSGHVKRIAGELIWTVCDEKQEEFVQRVGLGNALPILCAKGLVELPT